MLLSSPCSLIVFFYVVDIWKRGLRETPFSVCLVTYHTYPYLTSVIFLVSECPLNRNR